MTVCIPPYSELDSLKNKWLDIQEFDFISALHGSKNEAEVIAAYVRHFHLPFETQGKGYDLKVGNVLFEFKFKADLHGKLHHRAAAVAQVLYYLKSHHNSGMRKPSHFILADENEAAIYRACDFEEIYTDNSYIWNGEYCPSKPDPQLVEALIKDSDTVRSCDFIFRISNKDQLEKFSINLYEILLEYFVPSSQKRLDVFSDTQKDSLTPDDRDIPESTVDSFSRSSDANVTVTATSRMPTIKRKSSLYINSQLRGFVIGFMAVMTIVATAAFSYQIGVQTSNQPTVPSLQE